MIFEDLIDITIIVNVLFQKAKDAQAKRSIFTNCRAEKLRESENIIFNHCLFTFAPQQNISRSKWKKKHHHSDLAPSAANRAHGESFKTISSTLTLFLLKSRIKFVLSRNTCLCLCLCLPVLTCLQECVQWSSPHEVRHPRPETSQARNWLRQLPDDDVDYGGDDDDEDHEDVDHVDHDDIHQLAKEAKCRRIEVSCRHQ